MDAPEEELDIKLQKIAGDLIADFDRSLQPFLRRADGAGQHTLLRWRVRTRETDRLVSTLLEPFQELPQLLDPYLPKWLPILGDALLEYHRRQQQQHHHLRKQHRKQQQQQHLSTPAETGAGSHTTATTTTTAAAINPHESLLLPLPAAVCRVLYTLCKMRGEKVVVRFLSVETRHLELLLTALEAAERGKAAWPWTWEERYVVLLWLSHLLLAPFDLASISSLSGDGRGRGRAVTGREGDEDEDEDEEEEGGEKKQKGTKLPTIPGFPWPADLPGIARRILPVAIKYLASPGKERDAAKALLVRASSRRDMQRLGVLDALVRWSLAALRLESGSNNRDENEGERTPYYYIGILSFLAGILTSSADTADMDAYLSDVFYAVYGAAAAPEGGAVTVGAVVSSALARKTAIKVLRSVAVLVLGRHSRDQLDADAAATQLVETTVGFLLDSLADNDTPVRLAASKALSVVTLRLDEDMASQVVEAVLDALNRNTFWTPDPADPRAGPVRDLAAVDPLEWHGLTLTLAHLLYRRSPPASDLADIARALLTGLSFERRGPSGGSVGSNVRDAACFGVWALARRYTTAELLAVPVRSFRSVRGRHGNSNSNNEQKDSLLQVMATELVATACLDPAGNIRRGASAALQELIGRHPDTVAHGIGLVQAVDYHAVALRARAARDVALGATRLDPRYGDAVLDALLGWRGVGDADATSRRVAGAAFGAIAAALAAASGDGALRRLAGAVALVIARVRALQARQVEERHGLLLSFAAALDALPVVVSTSLPLSDNGNGNDNGERENKEAILGTFIKTVLRALKEIMSDCQTKTFRRPELVAEAACRLLVSSFPLLQIASSSSSSSLYPSLSSSSSILSGPDLVSASRDTASRSSSPSFARAVAALDTARSARHDHQQQGQEHDLRPEIEELGALVKANLSAWLVRAEQEVVDAAAEAGLVTLLVFCDKHERENVIGAWAGAVRRKPGPRVGGANAGLGAGAGGIATGGGTGYFSALAMAYPVAVAMDMDNIVGRNRDVQDEDKNEMTTTISSAMLARWSADRDVDTRAAILQSMTQTRSEMLLGAAWRGPFLRLVADGLDDYTTNARGDVGSHVRLQAVRATRALWAGGLLTAGTADEDQGEFLMDAVRVLFLRVLRLAAEKLDRVRVEAQACLGLVLRESYAAHLSRSTFSSRTYFRFLLDLLSSDGTDSGSSEEDRLHPSVAPTARADRDAWMNALMAGFVSSADTGNEDLVIASRAALVDFCRARPSNRDAVCTALVRNLRTATTATTTTTTTSQSEEVVTTQQQQDRLVVPTLEVIAFLFHADVFARVRGVVDFRALCRHVQRAAYKTGNVRKIEACVKVYGAVAALRTAGTTSTFVITATGKEKEDDAEEMDIDKDNDTETEAGVLEARKRLGALLFHPWPRVRNIVVDELWGVFEVGGGGGGRTTTTTTTSNSNNNSSGSGKTSSAGGASFAGTAAERLTGVDWGRADKATVRGLVEALGLA